MLIELIKCFKEVNEYSKRVFYYSIILCIIFFFFGEVCRNLAPVSKNFSGMMSLSAGYFEVAPACIAVGAISAVFCELIYKRGL